MNRPRIPEPLKRQVRQKCAFGCVLCAAPIYDYQGITADLTWIASGDKDIVKYEVYREVSSTYGDAFSAAVLVEQFSSAVNAYDEETTLTYAATNAGVNSGDRVKYFIRATDYCGEFADSLRTPVIINGSCGPLPAASTLVEFRAGTGSLDATGTTITDFDLSGDVTLDWVVPDTVDVDDIVSYTVILRDEKYVNKK